MVLGNYSDDAEEVEMFLRSKIQPNEGKRVNQMLCRGKVVGWAGLILDDTARAEVANHPGLSNRREYL